MGVVQKSLFALGSYWLCGVGGASANVLRGPFGPGVHYTVTDCRGLAWVNQVTTSSSVLL